jgi:hypothetical protein
MDLEGSVYNIFQGIYPERENRNRGNHEELQSEPSTIPGTSRIRSKRDNHCLVLRLQTDMMAWHWLE